MKKLLRTLPLVFVLALTGFMLCGVSGCSSVPSHRVAAGQSLKAIGQTAEAAVIFSAHLYESGHLTADQARAVMDFYDHRFQPAYGLAVAALHTDLSQPAPADLTALVTELLALINPPYLHPPP